MHLLARLIRCVATVVIVGLLMADTSMAQVKVRGYVRKDGTYVQPHYRSAPDGKLYNNWSTKGNFNPYTGEDGTKVSPPFASSGRLSSGVGSYVPSDNGTRASSNVEVKPSSSVVPYTPSSASTYSPSGKPGSSTSSDNGYLTLDEYLRKGQAENLKRAGVDVDWHRYSLSQLTDMCVCKERADDLKRLGVDVDWRIHSLSELTDMYLRKERADELKLAGVNVDWRQFKLVQLTQMLFATK